MDLSDLRAKFLGLIPQGGTICDAGCGSGRDAKAFKDQGYQVTAFDASLPLVKLAREFTALPVTHLSFEQMSYQEAFDGIWACSSLLHVPSDREKDIFERFVQALKPGGIWFMCYKVGAGESSDGHRFFRYHTKETLHTLINEFEGVTIVDTWHTEDRQPGRSLSWLNVLCRNNNYSAHQRATSPPHRKHG